MRADRLVATLLFLQARGRVTAAEVAAELEVSVKTARRDLEALSIAGIPVYPQRGRNGGWALVGGARTDLSGLTAAEACYIGDDLGDLEAMQWVGLPVAVHDAVPAIKATARYVTRRRGGDGAVREVCDLILSARAGESVARAWPGTLSAALWHRLRGT